MIKTREQFIDYIEDFAPNSGGIWVPEQQISGPSSQWFVQITPIANEVITSDSWWANCKENMSGVFRCYMSSEVRQIEWWGFITHEDAIWFLLSQSK